MKIGVITYHKARNYGALLLAFAMKKTIEELGGDCYFIEVQKEEKNKRSLTNQLSLYLAILKISGKMICSGEVVNLVKSMKFKKAKNEAFTSKSYQILDAEKVNESDFDLVIIGSDEVFNATELSDYGFTPQLFGDIKNAKRVITYAASCGPTTYEKILKCGLNERILQAMTNLSAISVRDRNTFEMVNCICGIEPQIHVDPVFLFDFKNYLSLEFNKNNYLLLYSFQYKITREERGAIIKYATSKGLQIVSIGCCYDWCSEAILPKTPFEVLDFVKNANFIITDTFHGVVFSIKYNKDFCALKRLNNKKKIGFLLEQFGLEQRCAKDHRDIPRILDDQIDYLRINLFLDKETKKSIDFLSQYIVPEGEIDCGNGRNVSVQKDLIRFDSV